MAIELTRQEMEGIVPSLQKFFREELEQELSELRARHVLDYILKEIAPAAYNRGVRDAETYFRGKLEDLTATCYEAELTYWTRKRR